MARITMLFAALAGAAAFQVGAPMLRPTPAVVSRAAPAQIAMQAGTKAEVIGAAAVGGIVGVYLFHELSTGVLLALVAAYAATTASSFGDATRSAGGAADKVYSKTLELNEQYDLLPKAKSAADAVTTAAVNIDRNYGARARRAPPLRIQRISARALPSARALLAEPPPLPLRHRRDLGQDRRPAQDLRRHRQGDRLLQRLQGLGHRQGDGAQAVDGELRLDGQPPVYLASQHTHIAVSRIGSRRNIRKSDVPGLSATASPSETPTRHLGPGRRARRRGQQLLGRRSSQGVVGRIARERQRTNCGLEPAIPRE